ncbi:UvrD-helicase domain-containing protein, partial [Angustibacter aerolatus]
MTETPTARRAHAAPGPVLRVRRERLVGEPPQQLDPAQRAVVAHRGSPLRVLAAPGAGGTTALVEAVVDRVQRDGLSPGQVLVLAPSRLAATRLRERVTARLGRTVTEPLARTPQSFGFGVLRRAAALAGDPPPRLITGPEQDVVLRELLAGHAAGVGSEPGWPLQLAAALGTRGFRGQLRDLLMRAVERGVDPVDLAVAGRDTGRPEWVAAARVLREYLEVTSLAAPGGRDPAAVAVDAVAALEANDDLLAGVRDEIRFVAVDDAHEATPAVAQLVHAVVGPRPDLLVVGDPDATTLGFRGADPGLLLADPPSGPASTVVLGSSWRQGRVLRAVTGRVAARVGAVGGGRQRAAAPPAGAPAGERVVHVVRSVAVETVVGVELLRRKHVLEGVPWSDMAVLVRGRARSAALRRGLDQAGVPVDVPLTELPVRDQPAVVPLLDAFEIALDLASGRDEPLPPGRAEQLLLSPLGGTDAMGLRRLRRALRADELAGGGGRPSDELLEAAVLDAARLGTVEPGTGAPARRVARVLAAGV